jgi:hypothetical protein
LRLRSAQGSEVTLEDYRGRTTVILWFTKGMACAFCRQHMSQLARVYPDIRKRGAEILQVTPSPLDRAQLYARRFKLPFPYLCDPAHEAWQTWGLARRSHGPLYYAKALLTGLTESKPPNDFGDFGPSVSEIPSLLVDDDMGFFVIDRAGVVRYALAGSYIAGAGVRSIPGPDDVMRLVEGSTTAA